MLEPSNAALAQLTNTVTRHVLQLAYQLRWHGVIPCSFHWDWRLYERRQSRMCSANAVLLSTRYMRPCVVAFDNSAFDMFLEFFSQGSRCL